MATFETRMRQRRIERCLRGASAALDANALDAAQKFLAEARVICPEHPEIESLNEQLVSTLLVSQPKRSRWSAAAVVVVLGLGLGCGALWASTPEGARTLTGLTTTVTAAAAYVMEIALRAGLPQSV